MNYTFSRVGALHPGKSLFKLDYEKKFDGDMGYLYPVVCDEVVPGDTWRIANQLVLRFNPLVAPIMHEINATVHYFFVPTRLLMLDKDKPEGSNIPAEHLWDKFISGGEVTDNDTLALEGDSIALPRWQPSTSAGYGVGTLWDYLGFPLNVQPDYDHCPLSFPKRAINFIWNEYYRDQNLQDEVDLDDDSMKKRAWEKDYFTCALPFQQKGVAPALPVNINGYSIVNFFRDDAVEDLRIGVDQIALYDNESYQRAGKNLVTFSNGNTSGILKGYVDSSGFNSTSFDINDLRMATQIQKYLERNARCGSRYTEFLRAHFGVAPTDARLDRPEYIGGSKSPIIFSEVLQTSGTQDDTGAQVTPQGNLAGHGITADSNFIASYHAEEFGYIIGLLSVMPRSNYQQGIDKQFLRQTKYDFYFPEFSHLSESAVIQAEIFTTDDKTENDTIFGYQGRYNEMRSKRSMICGNLRDTLNFWHVGRVFDNAPVLNGSFIECNPRKDIFAVPSQPGLIINFGNILRVARPMPAIAEPGLMDHF